MKYKKTEIGLRPHKSAPYKNYKTGAHQKGIQNELMLKRNFFEINYRKKRDKTENKKNENMTETYLYC